MRRIDTESLPVPLTPDVNLAVDETLLLMADEGLIGPTLRTWAFTEPTVVLGRSSKVDRETDRSFCQSRSIEIYRRCSGGASIVGGPGCLMYSVVLSLSDHPQARKIDAAHRLVMTRVLAAVQRQLPEVQLQGVCDLTWRDRKFSGNALRITRGHVLYHGTILHGADVDLIAQCLDFAPRQPDYRKGRPHGDFVTNAPLEPLVLSHDLGLEFNVSPQSSSVSSESILTRARDLAAGRYSQPDWRFRH